MAAFVYEARKKQKAIRTKTNGLINNLKRAYITYKYLKIKNK